MKNMTLRQIANACSGILRGALNEELTERTEITDVVTDSRKAGFGSLFAAIKGSRADGHDFIFSVFGQGAACVLTERELKEDEIPEQRRGDACWIVVRSTLAALRDIAEYYLIQLGIPAVGIAGSVGKTSTKEMVAAVLSQKFRVLKTDGNFNNELGVPLTIFRLTEEDEIAVLEMGISDFGEMHRLSRIVHPDTVVMTNIGDCHLEMLGDRDGVLRAKTEIFDFLKPDGHVILNGNDDKLTTLSQIGEVRPVFFGIPEEETAGPDADISFPGTAAGGNGVVLDVRADRLTSLGLEGTLAVVQTPCGSFECRIPMPGRHMVMNALAGAAVGLAYGMTLDEIRQGIESYKTVNGRFNVIQRGSLTIIDDCYNANPMSMAASLHVLGEASGRKVAVLGDMAELGNEEVRFHEETGACAADCGTDLLITVGERGKWIADGTKGRIPCVSFPDTASFLEQAGRLLREGDTVLVKASHCMQFEKIVEALCIS